LPVFDVFMVPPGQVAADDTGPYEAVRVVVIHADQLKAEITGTRLTGVSGVSAAPMTYTTLWCWLAMTRTNPDLAGKSFEDFRARVLQIKKSEEETETVDPTIRADPTP
jgi:hypothetical protein